MYFGAGFEEGHGRECVPSDRAMAMGEYSISLRGPESKEGSGQNLAGHHA